MARPVSPFADGVENLPVSNSGNGALLLVRSAKAAPNPENKKFEDSF
jgi:hypothetical protein